MKKTNSFLYKIPQGAEGLHWEDTVRRQNIVRGIQDIFTTWGYQPLQTPVFDFYDLYGPLIPENSQDKVYRLVDREGDLLMLRSDMTLFLARALGMVYSPDQGPLRVSYADSIFKHQHHEDLSANEFFQVGAEFVGSRDPEGDWEILLLVDQILDFLSLPEARIHLGHRGLVDALTPDVGLKESLSGQIAHRRWSQVEEVLGTLGIKDPQPWLQMFAFVGTPQEAQALIQTLKGRLPEGVLKALEATVKTAGMVAQLGTGDRVRVDLSEVGRQAYYTGLVFQVYTPGIGDALASGGRYDGLFKTFGVDSPSVGFSLHLKKIEAQVGNPQRFDSPVLDPPPQEGDFAQRYKQVQSLRAQGKNLTL